MVIRRAKKDNLKYIPVTFQTFITITRKKLKGTPISIIYHFGDVNKNFNHEIHI